MNQLHDQLPGGEEPGPVAPQLPPQLPVDTVFQDPPPRRGCSLKPPA